MSRPVGRRLAALLLTVLLVGACGAADDSEPPAAAPSPTAATPDDRNGAGADEDTGPPDAGVLDIRARTVDGDEVDLSVYAGRDVAIWFWAPW
jgi:hypothetical protein